MKFNYVYLSSNIYSRMNEWMNECYIYKAHNVRYSYALYINFKNTKFKTKIVLHINVYYRLKALLNRWVLTQI